MNEFVYQIFVFLRIRRIKTKKFKPDKDRADQFESEEKEATLKKQNELVLLRESTIREKAQSVMELIKERGHKPFSALYKIVDFVFNTRENKSETEIEKELMVGLEAWCNENKGDPKIRFNHWYKNKIIEIYKEKI